MNAIEKSPSSMSLSNFIVIFDRMNKLKEEFDLLSKLINQYRDENDKLKNMVSSSGRENRADFIITAQNNVISLEDTTNTKIKSPLQST